MTETNGYITREQLISASPRQFVDAEIAGLGKVRIRSLTEAERARLEAQNLTKAGTINIEKLIDARCRMVVACVCDAAGDPLLTNSDVSHLQRKDAAIINRLADAVSSHCGFTAVDADAAEKKTTTRADDSPES